MKRGEGPLAVVDTPAEWMTRRQTIMGSSDPGYFAFYSSAHNAITTNVAFPPEELFFSLVQNCCEDPQVAFVHCFPLEHAVYSMDAT